MKYLKKIILQLSAHIRLYLLDNDPIVKVYIVQYNVINQICCWWEPNINLSFQHLKRRLDLVP